MIKCYLGGEQNSTIVNVCHTGMMNGVDSITHDAGRSLPPNTLWHVTHRQNDNNEVTT